jgi:hypothetical protein
MDSMKRLFPLLTTVGALVLADGVAQAADPTTADCLSASEVSFKLGKEHKLRAKRHELLVCAAPSCPADIRKDCIGRVDVVNAQIPTIIFQVKDRSGGDLTAVKVAMDGEVLADRLEGTALSIDPGEHAFTFETAGQAPVTKKLVILEAQKERREVITLGTQTAETPVTATPPEAKENRGLGAQKIVSIVAGGVGVVGLGLGTAFGIMAMSSKSDAQNVCPNHCTTADGLSSWSDAASAGNISTVGFIIGGVGIAGAAVLWFTAPKSSTTRVGFGPGSLQLKGTW